MSRVLRAVWISLNAFSVAPSDDHVGRQPALGAPASDQRPGDGMGDQDRGDHDARPELRSAQAGGAHQQTEAKSGDAGGDGADAHPPQVLAQAPRGGRGHRRLTPAGSKTPYSNQTPAAESGATALQDRIAASPCETTAKVAAKITTTSIPPMIRASITPLKREREGSSTLGRSGPRRSRTGNGRFRDRVRRIGGDVRSQLPGARRRRSVDRRERRRPQLRGLRGFVWRGGHRLPCTSL